MRRHATEKASRDKINKISVFLKRKIKRLWHLYSVTMGSLTVPRARRKKKEKGRWLECWIVTWPCLGLPRATLRDSYWMLDSRISFSLSSRRKYHCSENKATIKVFKGDYLIRALKLGHLIDILSACEQHLSCIAMDSKGRKIIVCDAGTEVSFLYACGLLFRYKSFLYLSRTPFGMIVVFLVHKVWICRLKHPSAYYSFDGW